MKIHSFDEESESLIVSYASDETESQNPSDYQSMAIQPRSLWPSVVDPDELKKKIAQIGIGEVLEQKKMEDAAKTAVNIALFKSIVSNKSVSYNIEEITE
jgi:hypothetical protein